MPCPPPAERRAVDLMLQIPGEDMRGWYRFMRPLLMDEQSRNFEKMPAEYLFRDIPDAGAREDFIAYTVELMDRHGIAMAMLGVDPDDPQRNPSQEAIARHPDRFFGSYAVNPNEGMHEVRKIVRLQRDHGVKALTAFPAGLVPQVPIDDRRWYPIYAKAVELDLPICVTVGVPGPRLPLAPQKVELLDEVCWFFPELKVVMRHGGEPWVDLAVKLMLKYPNLFYSTSAFAPRHYPEAIVRYANARGSEKVMYAGYFPMGLSLDRVFAELPDVPFRDHVWGPFLGENATRVFGLTLPTVTEGPTVT